MEEDGTFYVKKDFGGHDRYGVLIKESDDQSMIVFHGLTEEQARGFCLRLNKAVALGAADKKACEA